MNSIENFYKKVLTIVCRECMTDPVMMFSSNKEKNVDARGVAVVILIQHKFSESIISELTGLTQQAVNRLKNIYPDRIRKHLLLNCLLQQINNELTETSQKNNFNTKDL